MHGSDGASTTLTDAAAANLADWQRYLSEVDTLEALDFAGWDDWDETGTEHRRRNASS